MKLVLNISWYPFTLHLVIPLVSMDLSCQTWWFTLGELESLPSNIEWWIQYSDVFGLKHHVFPWTMFHGHVTNNQRVVFWVKWRLDEIQWAFHQQSYDMSNLMRISWGNSGESFISYFSNKSITGFKGQIDLTNRVMGITLWLFNIAMENHHFQ